MGVLTAIAARLASGPSDIRLWAGDLLVIAGLALLLWRASRVPVEAAWSEFVRSTAVAVALIFFVAAQIVPYL